MFLVLNIFMIFIYENSAKVNYKKTKSKTGTLSSTAKFFIPEN